MLTVHMKTGYTHHKQLQVKLVCDFSPPLCCVFEEYFPLLKMLVLPVNTLSVLQVQRYYYNFCS